jgi:phenylalanyl-tRNA synthetase beta chain
VRVPLSWLRDFAPFDGDASALASTLDDLGLVVEGIEEVGKGLGQVVVARVTEVGPIDGADRIRRVVVDAGMAAAPGTDPGGGLQVVCGAWNFEVGDLVPLAPVGAVLPGDFAIGRRKMKGVVSNGMLCSGRELGLTEEHAGIMVLNDVHGAVPGRLLVDALGIEPDVVFDVAVEANRPDAWCIAGVARDLAARLGLPFGIPDVDRGPVDAATNGPVLEELASVVVDDTELCPRFTARVITGIEVGPSPAGLARRLTLAGMRPINNVVDASNYVMLELGQPTHPYDLDRLAGGGLLVRRAATGERVTTLDGVERELGHPGPGLGDTGQDCLICDVSGTPVGIAGVMGGESSEISGSTTRVLLEAAYFVPMAVARTSKRLHLRTEASARFERGCDPWGINRAVDRFCELLVTIGGDAVTVAPGVIDVQGDVPRPVHMEVRVPWVNTLLGTSFDGGEMKDLLAPLGITAEPVLDGNTEAMVVTVPTFRPDIRPAPAGEADIAEEVARTFGYSRLPRRTPSWPQPGGLTRFQRERRLVKEVLCGLGASEAWTATFVSEADQGLSGEVPPSVAVTNPLVESERFLRSSMAPGLVRALLYNTERRQGDLRLFEVGSTFHHPGDLEEGRAPSAGTSEHLCAAFNGAGDDAWTAVAAWHAIASALRIDGWALVDSADPVQHPFRRAGLASDGGGSPFGSVGELDPRMMSTLGLVGSDGRPPRVGWLDLDLEVLLDPEAVRRRSEEARPVSRFPSSDVDLAFAVDDAVPASQVERRLRNGGGTELESVELFDVYRGASVGDGARSLAYRLRFCALDRTLDDEELGALRTRCIMAVVDAGGAVLR